jgi:hypothetical protein
MTGEEMNRWNQLCSEAGKETDPKKLTELMAEMFKMLQARRELFERQNPRP